MTALITLEQAKTDLRIDGDDADADVSLKADMATSIILDYLKTPDADWTPETVPFVVKAAILLALRNLYDDEHADPISDPIMRLLDRRRDPSFA